MLRINWWKGQRITYQELKKNHRDTEKAINMVGAALSRYYHTSSTVQFNTAYGLPTYSEELSSNVTMILSAQSGAGYPQLGDYLYVSGNIQISNPFYVFFKSGDIYGFNATPSAGIDFILSGLDDIIEISDADSNMVANVGFLGDKPWPTTSGEIVDYINVSAGAWITAWTSAGFVSNDNELQIKPLLYDDCPSGIAGELLGCVWTSGTTPTNRYWNYDLGDEELESRNSRYEFLDYSDSSNFPIVIDRHNHFACVGSKDAYASDTLVTGSSLDYVGAGILSANLSATGPQLAVNTSIHPDPAGRYDARSYSKFLSEELDAYPKTEFTSAVDEMILFTAGTSRHIDDRMVKISRTQTISSDATSFNMATIYPEFIASAHSETSIIQYNTYFKTSASRASNAIIGTVHDNMLFVLKRTAQEGTTHAGFQNKRTKYIDLNTKAVITGNAVDPAYTHGEWDAWDTAAQIITNHFYTSGIKTWSIEPSIGTVYKFNPGSSALSSTIITTSAVSGASLYADNSGIYQYGNNVVHKWDFDFADGGYSPSAISPTGLVVSVMIQPGDQISGGYYLGSENNHMVSMLESTNEFGNNLNTIGYDETQFIASHRTVINDDFAIDISYYTSTVIDAQPASAKQLCTVGIWHLPQLQYVPITLDLKYSLVGSEGTSASVFSGAYASIYTFINDDHLYLLAGRNGTGISATAPYIDTYKIHIDAFNNAVLYGWT